MYAIVIGATNEAIHAIKQAQSLNMKVPAFNNDKNAAGLAYINEAQVS